MRAARRLPFRSLRRPLSTSAPVSPKPSGVSQETISVEREGRREVGEESYSVLKDSMEEQMSNVDWREALIDPLKGLGDVDSGEYNGIRIEDIKRQVMLERQTQLEAIESNIEQTENMMSSGIGAQLKHMTKLSATWVNPVATAIRREQAQILSGDGPLLWNSHEGWATGNVPYSDLRPYLCNRYIKPEELAYLAILEVLNATLRRGHSDEGWEDSSRIFSAVGRAINSYVYEERQKRRKTERKQNQKTKQKNTARSESRKSAAHTVISEGYSHEAGKFKEDLLETRFWPIEVTTQVGGFLVSIILNNAQAPEWWLESGEQSWKNEGRSDAWYFGIEMPEKIRKDIQETQQGIQEKANKFGKTRNDLTSEPNSKDSTAHEEVGCEPKSFSFPMWSPAPVRHKQPILVFEHKVARERTSKYKTRGKIRVNPVVRQVVEQVQALAYFPKWLPMVCPPRPWETAEKGGYYTCNSKLLRSKHESGQIQRSCVREADLSKLFEGLNAMGRTPWRINTRVLDVVNKLVETRESIADIPEFDDVDVPNPKKTIKKEDFENDQEYKKNLRRCRIEEKRALNENRNRHSLRCNLMLKRDIANRFRDEKSMYFPFNIDFRGRTYPIPPNFNHLGGDLDRALLLFANPKPLGDKGLDWLMVHLSNLCGNDKVPFKERVEFTSDHLPEIRKLVKDPLEHRDFWLGADDPFQALATCYEIMEAIDSGDPTTYLSSLPTHQDGSCNGLQHYAALGRDEFGGSSVNLTPSDRPQDVYSAVLKLVLEKIDKEAEEGSEIARMLKGHVNRKVVKQTVMTSVYGVTFIGARDQIRNRLREKSAEINWGECEDIDTKITEASIYLAGLTLGSITDLFNCAKEIMEWLGTCSSLITKMGQPVCWVTPLGLPVVQPYRKPAKYNIATSLQRVTIFDESDQNPLNKSRHKSAFPPNFVHSLDSTHMLLTAVDCKKMGLEYASVHDSYWTHAGTMDPMNVILREKFVELYKRPILEDLAISFQTRFPTVQFPPVPARGDLDLNLVQESTYFFA
ncbi:hypothetical protein AAMO2058_000137600 [Amorphochlora amoebiformis]